MCRVLVLGLLLLAVPALADDDNAPSATFHKGQIGISARFGLGLRGIKTYKTTDYCGTVDLTAQNGNAPLCTGRSPLRLDLEAAYGVAKSIEVLLEMRLGLEKDFGATPATTGPRPFHLSPGVRFFVSEAKHTKLFVTAQLAFDFSGYKDVSGTDRPMDFGVRSIEGVWIDLHRTYGIYFYIGETAEFVRWISGELEGGIGFQGRYP
ncbi:MAG: hypothetical protein JWO36_2363 [Myxococcales bacterium]|nr:hypothetical protein [Myxococcales bacterium]